MSLRTIFKYLLYWQVSILFVVSWSQNLLPLQTTFIGGGEQASFSDPKPYIKNPHLYFRGNFDGIHYINIARRGIGLYEEAFFPLYPKLIAYLNPAIKNTVISGSLVSTFFFFVGLYFFYKLIILDHNQNTAKWTTIALLLFPTSFFFTSVYTEGLFFFLSVASFYFARTRHWWISSLFVALAAYTRFVGIFLIPALFLEFLAQSVKLRPVKLLPFLIMPLGLFAYMNYLHQIKGDALAFIHVQKDFGQNRSDKIVLLYQVVYRYAKMLTTVSPANPLYITLLFESATALSFITFAIFMIVQKYRPSYTFYSLASLILPTFTGTFTSMPRYALLCFPIFIFLGAQMAKSQKIKLIYFAICVPLFIVFLSMFARGYWVA